MSLAPPFTHETANLKVKKAQDLWNTQYVLGSPASALLHVKSIADEALCR